MDDKWAQEIQSHHETVACTRYVAKKVAQESRRLCPIPSERRGPPRFARFPKFRIPQNPQTADRSVRRGISCDPSLGNCQSPKDHSTKEKNGSSRLKKSCSLSTKRLLIQDNAYPARKSKSETTSTPSSFKPQSIRGLMMESCT